MPKVKVFYRVHDQGCRACEDVEEQVNQFLQEQPCQLLGIHPALSEVAENEYMEAYTSFTLTVVYEELFPINVIHQPTKVKENYS